MKYKCTQMEKLGQQKEEVGGSLPLPSLVIRPEGKVEYSVPMSQSKKLPLPHPKNCAG